MDMSLSELRELVMDSEDGVAKESDTTEWLNWTEQQRGLDMRAVDGLGALGKALISLGSFFSFKMKQW